MLELTNADDLCPTIKVVGVGGAGGNMLSFLATTELPGAELIVLDTDAQALSYIEGLGKIQIGKKITQGLGSGANPEVGRQAATADRERIADALVGADLLIIVAGMGGGTGTGAAPIVAKIAKQLDILTVAFVSRPFVMEGGKRADIAAAGIEDLLRQVDVLVAIPNETLLHDASDKTTLHEGFTSINQAIAQAALAIIELINKPGLINVDFADVLTVLSEGGIAAIGVGSAQSEDRARIAAEAAMSSRFFEGANLAKASAALVNVTAGYDLSIAEFEKVRNTVKEFLSDDANVVVGSVIVPETNAPIRVTVIAMGFERNVESSETTNHLRLVVDESAPHEAIVELIVLLSDVYESVSTDRLAVQHIANLPPGSDAGFSQQATLKRSGQ